MLFNQFLQLSSRAQLIVVLSGGTYLAQRYQDETGHVNLYHIDDGRRGFFAEVGLDEEQGGFVVLRSFNSSALLAEYTPYVRFPSN
jgi:hypothetical protein